MTDISSTEWRALQQLADRFYRMAPWRWMNDSDVFGVENRELGETGFCCIMGKLGEFFGMAIYRGGAGLESYEQLLGSDPDQVPNLHAFEQNCLMLSFGSWEELMPQEQERATALKLSPISGNIWPSFRDYSPGLMPWTIEHPQQANYLTLCIQQALDFCPDIAASPQLLEPPSPMNNGILVRTYDPNQQRWFNVWEEIASELPASSTPALNTKQLRAEIGLFPRKETVWGVDAFYVPVPTQIANERPFFPQMIVIARFEDQQIIGHDLIPHGLLLERVQTAFTSVVQAEKLIPSRLIVRSYRALELWEELASILQIPLELDEGNALLEDIKENLFDSMT